MVYKPFRDDEPKTHFAFDSWELGLIKHALYAYDVENAIANGEEYRAAWDDKRRLLELFEKRLLRQAKREEERWI